MKLTNDSVLLNICRQLAQRTRQAYAHSTTRRLMKRSRTEFRVIADNSTIISCPERGHDADTDPRLESWTFRILRSFFKTARGLLGYLARTLRCAAGHSKSVALTQTLVNSSPETRCELASRVLWGFGVTLLVSLIFYRQSIRLSTAAALSLISGCLLRWINVGAFRSALADSTVAKLIFWLFDPRREESSR